MDWRGTLLDFARRVFRPITRIQQQPWGRADAFMALGTMIVGAILAFHGIDRESLWLDEALTFDRASMPPSELAADAIRAGHIPTYFLLLHYWLPFGDSEAMLRAPSALASVAAVGMTYCLGRVAGNRITGVAGALLLALSPFHIRYAQEARMYAHLTFAAAACMTGALYLFRHPERAAIPIVKRKPEGGLAFSPALGAWSLVAAGVTAALYLHNMATLFATTLGVAGVVSMLAAREHRFALFKNWSIAGAVALTAYLPWFAVFIQQAAGSSDTYWGSPSRGFVTTSVQHLFAMPRDVPVTTLMALSFLVVALVASWRRERIVAWSLLLFMLLPLALAISVSVGRSVFSPRTLIGCTPAAHVLVALGATYLASPLGLALLAVFLFLRVQLLPRHYAHEKKEGWREALTYIAKNTHRKAVVVALGDREEKQIRYYYERKSRPIRSRTFYTAEARDVLRRTAKAKSVVAVYLERRHPVAKPALAQLETVWQPGNRTRFQKIDVIVFSARQGEPVVTPEAAAQAEAAEAERVERAERADKAKSKPKRKSKRSDATPPS